MGMWVASMSIVSSAALNIGVHVSFKITVLSGYMPRSGTAGLYGNRYIIRLALEKQRDDHPKQTDFARVKDFFQCPLD